MAKRFPKLIAFDLEFVPNSSDLTPSSTHIAIPCGPCGLIPTLVVSVVDQAGLLCLTNIVSWPQHH